MIAKRENRNLTLPNGVWVGKYRNSHNLPHWHFNCELLCVEKGEIDVFCGGRTHTLAQGDAIFIDSEEVHFMHARVAGTVLCMIVFDYNIVKPYLGETRLSDPRLSGNYPVSETYASLREKLLLGRPFCGAETAAEVLRLTAEIFRGEQTERRTETDSARSLRRLLQDVSERAQEYTFRDAAEFMNMSEAYFSRFFHKSIGIPFSQYLNYVRTDKAVQALREGGRTVTEVSELCGFGTVRTFNRVMKELTGFSPRDLPRDFVLDDKYAFPSEEPFDPNLYDCELIESGESD